MLILASMEKIDTSHIECWPQGVVLGTAEIKRSEDTVVLSESELKVYNGFKNSNRKAEFLSVRYLFYSLLDEMGLPLKETKLLKHEDGKPYAKVGERSLHVSFSHSPEKVFCAISFEKNIGLDVEHLSRNISQPVLDRIRNEKEESVFEILQPVQVWTIKEAVVKCMGSGLRTNLKDLIIEETEKNRFSVRFYNESLFEICSFRQSNHQIALAYQSQPI